MTTGSRTRLDHEHRSLARAGRGQYTAVPPPDPQRRTQARFTELALDATQVVLDAGPQRRVDDGRAASETRAELGGGSP